MIKFKIVKNIKNVVVILDVESDEINSENIPLTPLILDVLNDFDDYDYIVNFSEITLKNLNTDPIWINVKWVEEWDYTHTECDSYFEEIK